MFGFDLRQAQVALFEEFDRQDCGQAPENIEIIPFDNVSPRCGGDYASEICWNEISHRWLPPCYRRSTFQAAESFGISNVVLPPGLLSCVVPTPPFSLDEKINMKLNDEISLICVNTILQLKSGIVLVSTNVVRRHMHCDSLRRCLAEAPAHLLG